MPAPIALTPVDDERNRAAREAARRRVSWPANLAPETVDFESEGYLLIAGAELDIRRAAARLAGQLPGITLLDRKSTRLNSSHVRISYAVFCLKKKKHLTGQNPFQDVYLVDKAMEDALRLFSQLYAKIRRNKELMCSKIVLCAQLDLASYEGNP